MVNQIADDLPGSRARTDNHSGTKFCHRHATRPQYVAGLLSRAKVGRTGCFRYQASEIHNPTDTLPFSCSGKVTCRACIEPRKVRAGRHRVHEVVGGVDVLQHPIERIRSQGIGRSKLDVSPFAALENLDITRRRAYLSALPEQKWNQMAAYVATGSEYEVTAQR